MKTFFHYKQVGRLLLLFCLLLSACAPAPTIRPEPQNRHESTHWQVEGSLILDAIAFINVLSGDPLAAGHYQADIQVFAEKLSTEAKQAFVRLGNFREKTIKSNLSGFLYPWFLFGKPQSLDDLIGLAGQPEQLKQAMKAYDESLVEMNVYYNEEGWQKFKQIAADVKIALIFLRDAGFAAYWQEKVFPQVEDSLDNIQAQVESYNIVPEIEAVTGFGLPSHTVVISVLYFEWPYGHHMVGTHFATVPEDQTALRSTVHELLHNPFNNTDPAFWNAANSLQNNSAAWQAYAKRNEKWGYNNWPYYVAENSVRALEQLIEEKAGLGKRWTWMEDGGMHQLAKSLYTLMKEEAFPQNHESYQAFFVRMVEEGKLQQNDE